MGKLFGTDGVRGVAGTELDCQLAYDLGRAGAHVLTDTAHKPKILVGRDTRISAICWRWHYALVFVLLVQPFSW